MARDRSGVCDTCAKALKRLDLHHCNPKGMPLSEIYEKYPSTQWGQAEWFEAFQKDDGLFYSILDGIAGRNREIRWI